ncbi:MAG: hypothetical protein EOO44_02240 [Flavobacterium sp.]|nr:MAG: hypothetical protein EOO44_02240 [Flavobacterium sp.]
MAGKFYIILLFFVLISCTKKPVVVNKFVGNWYDTEYRVPGRSVLKIKKDSSFSYKGAGCDWRIFSKGKWKMIGDSIQLTSINSDTCYRVMPFIFCKPFTEYDRNLVTIPNCDPNEDTGFVSFSKEIFYIKNDSLIYKLKKESQCSDSIKIIYARTEKIKKQK